jgi:nitronate monooxygenase
MGLIHDIPTCDELVTRMVAQARDLIHSRLAAMMDKTGSEAAFPA